MREAREPGVARRLVAALTPAEDRPYLLADLRDGFLAKCVRSGHRAAWAWYWWQALRAIPARIPAVGGGRDVEGGPGLRPRGIGVAARMAWR